LFLVFLLLITIFNEFIEFLKFVIFIFVLVLVVTKQTSIVYDVFPLNVIAQHENELSVQNFTYYSFIDLVMDHMMELIGD
jgi:hypothetical protein